MDSDGNTLDFLLSETRDAKAATQFFRKTLGASHTVTPRVITMDILPEGCALRQSKYGNNIVEQDHQCMKHCTNPGLGFGSFATAERMLQGYEAMHMIRNGQLRDAKKVDVLSQNAVIAALFGGAA